MNEPSLSNKHRRPTRLPDYDYTSAGAYFITICINGRSCILGRVQNGVMYRNGFGQIAEECWNSLPKHYQPVTLDAFVVMPNHVHGILVLEQTPERTCRLSEVVRAFMSFSARQINARLGKTGMSLWQRGYYEHVIRNDISLAEIRTYIETNPLRWELDRENPDRIHEFPAVGAGLRPAPTPVPRKNCDD